MALNDVPDWAHSKLERRANKAVLFLQQLTTIQQTGEGLKVPTMPKSAVVSAEGIAIKYKSKYGALLTRTTERGFVIRKLTGPGGEIRWSAPVFLQGSAMGAGLSGGYRKSRTCIALANDQAVQSALRSQSEFGPCVHFLLDMNGTRIKRAHFDSSDQASQTAVSQDRHGGMTAKYYQVDAAMVDISVEGGSTYVDKDFNAAVYGQGVTAEGILSGEVPPPAEFQLLYTVLQQFVDETPSPVVKRELGASGHGARSIRSVRSINMKSSPEEGTALPGVALQRRTSATPSVAGIKE
uniref:Ysc84 actin-binding domain-containing protein n=1 Tax=Auxenochlorella protothecoides TaxID=3075 RepID=A0A1D1ZPZ5_AUXPR